ncbi:MAG: SWIM zinc finger family protein [Pseudomonadota bacterium]
MKAVDWRARYKASSALMRRDKAEAHLRLVADAEGAPDTAYLVARALRPEVTAAALRAVSEIVGSRFYVPPAMLARILREADPVATVSAEAVRFEGFSACCSAYARLDIENTALEAATRQAGTTNVDFGPKLRGALAQIRPSDRLDISIGAHGIAFSDGQQEIVEHKVPLPERWITGFGDVQVAMAGMERAFSLNRIAAQRFLRGLPRGKNDHVRYVSSVRGQGLSSSRQSASAVPLRGAHRLRVLEPLAPKCESLAVYVNPALGSTAWVLEFAGQRFSLVLNAEPWRGFSGDGGLLGDLADGAGPSASTLHAALKWHGQLEAKSIARRCGCTVDLARNALARLAGEGLLGFDLADGSYFHRALPYQLADGGRTPRRLEAAEALATGGHVTVAPDGKSARVTSGEVVHHVSVSGSIYRCTCPWFARNGASRGPCKHVLATQIVLERVT